jgi:O-antigen biosynthesis protein
MGRCPRVVCEARDETVTASPFFSIVTPVYEPPLQVLRETIESVQAQTLDDWELILVDDNSPSEAVREILRDAARRDRRIKVIERAENGHIVAASNDGLAAATGEFVALLDHDDTLAPNALERVRAAIGQSDDIDYLYSDEDKLFEDGSYRDAFCKPDWSPERLRGHMYCGHLSVFRATVLEQVHGFQETFDGSQDYDLILRVTEIARRIVHIPEVLYHWRILSGSVAGDTEAKPYAYDAALRAIQAHFDRLGLSADVQHHPQIRGHYVPRRSLDPATKVSIIIPTAGKSGFVWGEPRCFVVEAVRSAIELTEHENLEWVVVYDVDKTPRTVLDQLRDIVGAELVLVRYEGTFNFSRKINLGVIASSGDRVVLLNDDVQALSGRWLEELVAPLDEADVGMTGAKLYFSDSTLQHAGHRYANGTYHHSCEKAPREDPGLWGVLSISHETSGVTAACSAMRREVFDEVGGLCEPLPANFNDVDLSYKVRHLGYRIVWVAHCELYHFESQTRGRTFAPQEEKFTQARWGVPEHDPYSPV